MKSITIHKLDSDLYSRLVKQAEEEGLSLNKLIKQLLRQSLKLDPKPPKRIDFSGIAGKWSKKDFDEFSESVSTFNKIDKAEW